jgi:hypothetical protein
MKQCKVDGCENKVIARGWCNKHWQRWRIYGDPAIIKKEPLPNSCGINGCDRKPHARWDGTPLCNMHYLRIMSTGTTEQRQHLLNTWSICCVIGCDKPSRSPGNNSMCEMHYYRKRRTGNTEIIKQERIKNDFSKDYVKMHNRNHPMSCSKNGMIYQHRQILFDKIGWGPHKCFWCGDEIDWMPGERNKKGSLVVDHFNGNKRDNKPDNLIPSCHKCNATRGLIQKWIVDHGEDTIMLMKNINQ